MTSLKKTLALPFATFVGLTLASTVAHAQALRPNIMVIFDTSGSMLESFGNNSVTPPPGSYDGSPLCNGYGTASRMNRIKNALRDALAQVGTDEANFGLMRFPQTESTGTATCPAGHWSAGSNSGCRMSTQSGSSPQTTYGTWFDTGAPQSILIPVTRPTTGTTPLRPAAATDYDPTGANITSIYKWIDTTDSGMTGAANPDPELRSPSGAYTPLGRSLFYSRLYFENYVYPLDPKKTCRQNIVILATDGAETCDEGKNATVTGTPPTLNTTTCAVTGGTFDTFHPETQACLANHSTVIPKGIQTYVLTDSALNANEQAAANLIASAGGTTQAIFVSLTDTAAVKKALVDIIAKTVPPVEVCNGVDDNCNGLIDEGVSNMCVVANPNSTTDPDNLRGTAARHCAIEICNCMDDDCDGQVDEGFAPNACGMACGCAIPTEICDGLDNDCDGDVDEGFNVGATCTNNGVGVCRRGGLMVCNAAGNATQCDAPTGTPQTEVCNNLDDDCDGMIDEGTLPGVGEKCGNGLGTCQSGTYVCTAGRLVCNATGNPQAEVCNGIDDNCDGVIDNGNFPQTGTTCLCPPLTQAQVSGPNSVCKAGHMVCRGAMGFVCEGCVLPTAEICDGKDNDCDGVTDTAAKCPSGFGCRDGQCALQCSGGEFPCPAGYKCVNLFCVPQRCANVSCPSGQKCDETNGTCVDVCAGVVCASPKICIAGTCQDCNNQALACTGDKLCIGGTCQTDKCKDKQCEEGTYCDDGICKDLCVPGKCPEGQRCAAGQCLPDKCAQVACQSNQYCNQTTGECVTNQCITTQCGAGMTCVSQTTTCKNDPCRTIQCPGECWHCGVTSDGIGTCMLNSDCRPIENRVGQRGGAEGCGCAVEGGSPSAAWLSLLGAFGLIAARRRRPRR